MMHLARSLAHLSAVTLLAAGVLTVAAGCEGAQGAQGEQGEQGEPGEPGPAGKDGTACTVADNNDGTKTISCDDGTSVTVSDGADGADGADGTSCTVADNGDGTKTISCDDGTSVTVSDGADGQPGEPGPPGKPGPAAKLPGVNYIAVHDPDAPGYNDDCVSCHADKLEPESLDPDTAPGFHALKLGLPIIPGDTANAKCVYCHKRVEIGPASSAGNLRRHVDVTICAGCHSAGALKFYQ